MIDGIILGFLTWISFVFSFIHFSPWVKRFMLKHFFITDVISVVITFFLLSSISHSITSVIGSITCGVLINITLMLNNAKGEVDEQNPANT
jgi:hypothetical protein